MDQKKFLFRKLVRDHLVQLYQESKGIVDFRKLSEQEHITELKRKLEEESKEVMGTTSREELIDELSDLYEILEVLTQKAHISDAEIIQRREEKKMERGGFYDGYYIESLQIDRHHPFAQYLEKQPEKYPEIPCED